jgi:thiol-disulfide isomerase/thioredoxin
MSNLVNQFSYPLFATAVVIVALLVLWRLQLRKTLLGLGVLALVAIFAAGWVILRPGAQDVDSVAAAEQVIASGRPTLVEFFSNYCVGCMAVRAQVDDLVDASDDRFGDDLNILRIDIHTELGRALRERYGFSYSPEFVLFDRRGEEVWRSHLPPTLDELEAVVVVSAADEVVS